MIQPGEPFFTLDQFLGAHFHQDMDLFGDSVPEVVAVFARAADEDVRRQLEEDMSQFEAQHHNDLHRAFVRVLAPELDLAATDREVTDVFAMVRAILADPSVYTAYETGKDF